MLTCQEWPRILPLLDDKLARIRCSAIDALVALGGPMDMHSSWADDTYEVPTLFEVLMHREMGRTLQQQSDLKRKCWQICLDELIVQK